MNRYVVRLPGRPADSMLIFAPVASGWAWYWPHAGDVDQNAHDSLKVRFNRGDGGPHYVAEAIITFAERGVRPRTLRELPLARLEAAANSSEHYEALAVHLGPPTLHSMPFPEGDYLDENGAPWWAPPVAQVTRRPRLRLRDPGGYRKPDAFYQQVADRFSYLTTVSSRPAQELAEANDVPTSTVHGWVKEARRRGCLPAGERHPRRSS